MDLLEQLSQDWGAMRFVAGFVALPFLYLRESAEVHKEFALYIREAKESQGLAELHNTLYVFDLDWWLILAVSVYMLVVFLLGDVAAASERASQAGLSPRDLEAGQRLARGIVNAFSLVMALSAMYYVEWSKSKVYRALREAAYHSALKRASS